MLGLLEDAELVDDVVVTGDVGVLMRGVAGDLAHPAEHIKIFIRIRPRNLWWIRPWPLKYLLL